MPFIVTRVRRPKDGPLQVEVEVHRGRDVEMKIVDVPATVNDAPRYIAEQIGMPVPDDQANRLMSELQTAAKTQFAFPLLEELPEKPAAPPQAKPPAK